MCVHEAAIMRMNDPIMQSFKDMKYHGGGSTLVLQHVIGTQGKKNTKINGNKKRTHEGKLCTIESYNNPRPRLSTRRCPGPCHEHTLQSKTPTWF